MNTCLSFKEAARRIGTTPEEVWAMVLRGEVDAVVNGGVPAILAGSIDVL